MVGIADILRRLGSIHWGVVLFLVARLNLLLGASMIVPLTFGAVLREDDVAAHALAMLVTFAVNGPFYFFFRKHSDKAEQKIFQREGILVVSLGWMAACVFGALPFWFYGLMGGHPDLASFTNAVFESVSGFSTTGASIMSYVEGAAHGILWWRAVIQWYGGMGIIVFFIILLPQLGIAGMQLYKAEVSGPTADKFTPRLRDTARLLWRTYALLTAAGVTAMIFAGMNVFESFCHVFTAMATGGFSTRNAGIMTWASSPAVIIGLTILMVAAAANFTLHMEFLFNKRLLAHLKDEEFKVYLAIMLVASLIITALLLLHHVYDSFSTAFMHAAFNFVSLMTCTGFNSADFDAWANAAPAIGFLLFGAMLCGGMVGSTTGAIKVMRIVLVAKMIGREIKSIIHPRGVFPIRFNGGTVRENVLHAVIVFFALYLFTFFAGTLLVCISGLDLVSGATAVATCMGGVGPGLGKVGPTQNYGFMLPWAKWVLSALMLLGRLEIYTVLVLFAPAFWRE